MKLFLIALLSVLVGVLIGTLLSQGVMDPFLPSPQMLTIADDYIFLC